MRRTYGRPRCNIKVIVHKAGKKATIELIIHCAPPCSRACVMAVATSSGFIVSSLASLRSSVPSLLWDGRLLYHFCSFTVLMITHALFALPGERREALAGRGVSFGLRNVHPSSGAQGVAR